MHSFAAKHFFKLARESFLVFLRVCNCCQKNKQTQNENIILYDKYMCDSRGLFCSRPTYVFYSYTFNGFNSLRYAFNLYIRMQQSVITCVLLKQIFVLFFLLHGRAFIITYKHNKNELNERILIYLEKCICKYFFFLIIVMMI